MRTRTLIVSTLMLLCGPGACLPWTPGLDLTARCLGGERQIVEPTRAETVQLDGEAYFLLEVPADAVLAARTDRHRGGSLACEPISGPVREAYLVAPPDPAYVVQEPGADLAGLEESERTRYRELEARQREIQSRIPELNRRRTEVQSRLGSSELSEAERERLRDEYGDIVEEMETLRTGEQRAVWRELQTLRQKMSEYRRLHPEPVAVVGRLDTSEATTVEVLPPRLWTGSREVVIRGRLPAARRLDGQKPRWLGRWARAHLENSLAPGDDPAYVAYYRTMLEQRFDVAGGSAGRAPDDRPLRSGVHPYDLFTGSAAIRESAQLDRFLAVGPGSSGSVPISEVRRLDLEDHPFDSMRGGRAPVGSSLARLCPRDAVYVRIRSLQEWFRLADLADGWGGGFLTTVQVTGKDQGVFDRYARQLGLGNEVMARLVGTRVIGEFALIAGDPLLARGTGVAALFRARDDQGDAMRSLLDAQRQALALPGSGVRRQRREIEGVAVDLLETDDWTVRSYACTLGEVRVIANSPELLGRVIRAAAEPGLSLGQAADYRYYRSLFPLDDGESGFAYLSQDWFRRITGPAWRIAHGRRRSELRILENVRYAWQTAMEQGQDGDIESLRSAGLLTVDRETLERLGVAVDPVTGEVRSERVGPLSHPRPVDELLAETVHVEEVQLYDRFREQYSRYWRQFIDPVGIRIGLSDDQLLVDTLILPLIDNSIYSTLRVMTGSEEGPGGSVPPLPETTVGAVNLHLNLEKSGLDRFLSEVASAGRRGRYPVAVDPAWFGRTLTFGVADGDLFLTANPRMAGEMLQGFRFGGLEELAFAGLLSSLTLPVFAAVEVEDQESVSRLLGSLFDVARSSDAGFLDLRLRHYQTAGVEPIHTVTLSLFVVELRVHYTFAGRWLLLATRPDVLVSWRDRVRAARDGSTAFLDNGRLTLRPSAFDRAARTVGIVWQERVLDACRGNLVPLGRALRAGWFDRSEAFLGYRTLCPEGGRYEEREPGSVVCTLHGSWRSPTQPLGPARTAPAVRLVNRMESVTVGFRFTEDGLRTRLDVRFSHGAVTE